MHHHTFTETVVVSTGDKLKNMHIYGPALTQIELVWYDMIFLNWSVHNLFWENS